MNQQEGALAALLTLCIGLWFPAYLFADPEIVYPADSWIKASPEEVGMNAEKLQQAREYALTGDGSGYITRHGKLVMSWGDVDRRYDLKSTTKSIGVTALGLAIADGKINLSDQADSLHPNFGVPPESNVKTGWLKKITIEHLATQTAGFDKPGGYEKLMFEPGTKWAYSDGGPNWLAEIITLKYGRDLQDLMFDRVFTPLGIEADDLRWRNNSYRPKLIEGTPRREFGSGIHANVDAMARIGYLYLRKGRWKDRQILPKSFVELCHTTPDWVKDLLVVKPESYGKASQHYGLLWWNNSGGTLSSVPRDAYWSWGLYDSLIVVIPSLDIVIARAGKSWKRQWNGHYDVLHPFLGPIAASVRQTSDQQAREENCAQDQAESASHPSVEETKPLIIGVEWAPVKSIVRRAKGSDNWPMTWADDNALYTAYGDGWGFEPKTPKKLSMGLAKILGDPPDFHGVNLRAATLEQTGDGPRGKKASGMLMVSGVLYLLARNADNAQLAWSRDHGKTWTWSDWKFTTSFGCPTFLSYGKNYAGARDNYVYVFSPDSDSAYQAADQMVLARVPKDRLTEKDAYEFFAGGTTVGGAKWSPNVEDRAAVLERRDRCYRGGVTYNAPLKRYLWVAPPGGDTRFEGGLSIYEAREPWGPWTEVYHTDRWDVGPGETASFPTKWMSEDGKTLQLVFSGNDTFSVRKAKLKVSD